MGFFVFGAPFLPGRSCRFLIPATDFPDFLRLIRQIIAGLRSLVVTDMVRFLNGAISKINERNQEETR